VGVWGSERASVENDWCGRLWWAFRERDFGCTFLKTFKLYVYGGYMRVSVR
jgi:hypothetical protein